MVRRVQAWWHKENRASKILSIGAFILLVFSFLFVGVFRSSFAASSTLPEKLITNTLYSDDGYRVNLFPSLSGSDIISLTPFVASDGNKTYHMYCLERTKDWYDDTVITKGEKLDAGYAYIMMNGYPEKSLSGEGDWVDSYLTQVALWLYQDRSTGVSDTVSGSLTAKQKQAILSSKYYSIIQSLVTGAIQAKDTYRNVKPAFSISSSNFHLDSSYTYLETDYIRVSSNVNFSSYQVALSISGAQVVAEDGTLVSEGASISSGKRFKIRLPLDKVDSTSLSLSVSITINYQEHEAYQYRPTEYQDSMQLSVAAFVEAISKQAVTSVEVRIPTGSLSIAKIDGSTQQLLPGAKIEVYREVSNQKKLVYSFDSTTTVQTISNLLPGKYTIVETNAPSGYLIQSDSQSVILDTDDLNVDVKLVNTPIVVQVRKVDASTNEVLEGAVIKIVDSDGKEVYRFTSAQGYTKIPNLSVGQYQAIEVSAPDGYYLNSEPYDFSITEDTTSLSITLEDEKNQVEILKVDADSGKALSGARLRVVHTTTGDVVAEFVTTEEKKVLSGLPAGVYQVEEVSAPSGYVSQANVMSFTVSNTQTKKITVRFSNTKSKVTISKVNEEGKLISGATIAIYDDSGKKVSEFVSKSSPTVIEKLAVGHYTAKEIESPDGYQLNRNPVSFEVKEDTENLSLTLQNVKKAFYFGKVDADTGELVSGAILRLVDTEGKVVKQWTSSNDLYMITGLTNGTYYLEEVSAPSGYVTTSSRVKVTVTDDSTTATYTLKNKKVSVKIAKVDSETKEMVEGATLELLNSNYEVLKTWTSGTDYQVFDDLSEGVYYVKEASAPEGYVLNSSFQKFTIDEEHPTVVIDFKNKKTTVKVGKVDASSGDYIAGATLELSRVDGAMDAIRFVSDDEPTVFRGLAVGVYTLEEIEAPSGYVSSDSKITFEVSKDGKMQEVALKSEFLTISIQDKRLVIDTHGVAGYEFQLFTIDNVLVDTYQITEKGFTSSILENGEYLLLQTKAADGRVLNSTPYTFTISDTMSTDVIKFSNDYTKVQFDKKEMVGGKELAGGHFILREEDGSVVEEWDSTDDSKYIYRLSPGTYTLSEVKAPDGYQISQAALSFQVEEKSDIQVVTMFNVMEVDVPNTSRNTLIFWFIGLLILFSGFSVFSYAYLKKQG